jgi:hypothetical protein
MKCENTYVTSYIRVGTYRILVRKLEEKRPVGRPSGDGKLK